MMSRALLTRETSALCEWASLEETNNSQIKTNHFFGYNKITIEQPLYEKGIMLTNKQPQCRQNFLKNNFDP